MIGALSLQQLAERCGIAKPDTDVSFMAVTTDSRQLRAGDLFVALRGERFDGHDFITAVASAGACAAVVEERKDVRLPQLVVNNTVTALGKLGELNRERFSGKVVAITGSSGKTTVKEMLASILATQGKVLATKGNLNNHIGVPLTLLQINSEHQFAVIEMGASAVGEIAWLAELSRPDVSVVNNVGSAHVGGFGSVANIARGKGEIYRYLSNQGTAIINRDDSFSDEWIEQNRNRRRLTFSLQQDADVMATHVEANRVQQYSFCLQYQRQSISISLSLVGRHNVANALAAAACALALGIDLVSIKHGLEQVQVVAGRMQVKTGISGSCVIDDTYNANPASVRAAIDALSGMEGRRILVLGTMAELGDLSSPLHAEVGSYARQQGIDALYACGDATQYAVNNFGKGGQWFVDKAALVRACVAEATLQSVFLVKGSRSAAMETVVQGLMMEKAAC